MLDRLQAKLADMKYCRDGYPELERVIDRGHMTICGECKEGASDTDRTNFTNEQSQQPSMLHQFETLKTN
ncbi:hypothetical protein [Microbulbifer donghaiensis]|uniref:hypothetical protein n=1 Tax=Microbulbifer donghaiensis TaxID=494016 RepID=UPI0009321BA9|nr:hypothetical protein [Microbulbifer donghaiensis]